MHKSRIVQDWFHTAGVSVLDFPAYSPDMNPIENFWAILARIVEKKQCKDDEALGDAVIEAWNEMDSAVFKSLAHSMPTRCRAVIHARGQHTKY